MQDISNYTVLCRGNETDLTLVLFVFELSLKFFFRLVVFMHAECEHIISGKNVSNFLSLEGVWSRVAKKIAVLLSFCRKRP